MRNGGRESKIVGNIKKIRSKEYEVRSKNGEEKNQERKGIREKPFDKLRTGMPLGNFKRILFWLKKGAEKGLLFLERIGTKEKKPGTFNYS